MIVKLVMTLLHDCHRLDAAIIAFQLMHGESKVLITDTEHSVVVEDALKILDSKGHLRYDMT